MWTTLGVKSLPEFWWKITAWHRLAVDFLLVNICNKFKFTRGAMLLQTLDALRVAVAVVVGACILATVYVVVAMATYMHKRRKKCVQSGLCLGAGTSIVLRCCAELVYIFYGSTSNIACSTSLKVHICLYAMPIICIYMFLWNRQRFLYRKPSLRSLNNKITRTMSRFVMSFMVVSVSVTIGLFMKTRHYESKNGNCHVNTEIPETSPWIVLVTSSVVFQITLLGLFVHPLLRGWRERRSVRIARRCHPRRNPLLLAKRAMISTLICVTSDLSAGAITCSAIFQRNRILLSNVVYDLNLVINLFCIVCSFPTWSQRLFPFRMKPRYPTPPTTPMTPFTIESFRQIFFRWDAKIFLVFSLILVCFFLDSYLWGRIGLQKVTVSPLLWISYSFWRPRILFRTNGLLHPNNKLKLTTTALSILRKWFLTCS